MKTPHILVVEDDRQIRDLVAQFLELNGLTVTAVTDGIEMDKALKDEAVSLVVLDRMLPGEDGLSICRRLRANSDMPVILLTALSDDIERIIGLEMGADDYVGKPFNPRELLARIRAVLRRRDNPHGIVEEVSAFTFLGWRLDAAARRLSNPDGVRIAVTGAEFELLRALCEHAGRVLSRDTLLDLTQGRAAAPFERSIDVLISRLRQKIERDPRDPDIIRTIRSSGYLFTPAVQRQ